MTMGRSMQALSRHLSFITGGRGGATSVGHALRIILASGALAVAGVMACGTAAPPPPGAGENAAESTLVAKLPSEGGPFSPALTRLTGEGSVDGAHIGDVETCGSCHPDAFAQQQTSAHAFASFSNPVYRYAVDHLRNTKGKRQSQMCGGCHDISLLIDGAMLAEVEPRDDRAHNGVTCRVCHGIEAATTDGNGSYTLSRVPIPVPEGSDPESLEVHKRAAKPIAPDVLCGSCHRSFLNPETGNDHFLAGQDEVTALQSSAYNHSGAGRVDDPIPKVTCLDCHMRMEPAVLGDVAANDAGEIRSHRFLGAHTWMASMIGDEAQLARQAEFLRSSMTVDIAAAFDGEGQWTRPADGAPVTPGRFGFDVVVRNVGVGHRFPAGVRDAVDSWLEIVVTDARGQVIAESRDGGDVHRFRSLVGDRHGMPQLVRNTHDFYEPIVDHTIPARDARVVRYQLEVPADLTDDRLPLHIEARLLHRTRNLEVQRAACEDARSPRGRAFAEHQESRGQPVLDPCQPQPITEIAASQTFVGKGAEARLAVLPRALEWKRLYEHALGLLPELPREAPAARDSLLAAMERVSVAGDERERAKLLAAMGAVYAGAPCGPSAPPGWPSCQGRFEEALRWLAEADAIVPGHPAIAAARARIYDRSFRWPESAESLAALVEKAPDNVGAWRSLAAVLQSLNRHEEALRAAHRGLELLPRDDDLLRVQALALRALGAPEAVVQAAERAYEVHEYGARPDEMQAACSTHMPACNYERFAVHTHNLSVPAPETMSARAR